MNDSSAAVASANRQAIQSEIDGAKGVANLILPGIVYIDGPILMPDNSALYIGNNVTLKRTQQPIGFTDSVSGVASVASNTGNVIRNRESWKNAQLGTGVQQSNIMVWGPGTIDGNAEGMTGVSVGATYASGIHMDQVDKFWMGGGLKVRMCTKYQIYGSALTNFVIDGVDIYSDDTINPSNGSSIGRDGIHIQGNTDTGLIRNISGQSNDDFIALNVRDVPGVGLTAARSIGPIRNIVIENITGKNVNRTGNRICLYGGRYTTASGDFALPSITGMAQTGAVVTVTTAAAHGMYPGQMFSIGSSNPSGYDGSYLEVIDCPSTTTFRYLATTGLAAWVGGSVFTKLYHTMENITVRNLRSYGNYSGNGLSLSVTTDVINDGIIKGLVVDGLDTGLANPSAAAGTAGVFSATLMRAFDPIIRHIKSRGIFNYPAVLVNGTAFLDGAALIDGVEFLSPFEASSSGVNPINVASGYRNLTIRNVRGAVFTTAGSQRQIIAAGAAGGVLTVENCAPNALTGGLVMRFVKLLGMTDAGTVILRGNKLQGLECAIETDSTVTAANIILDGNDCRGMVGGNVGFATKIRSAAAATIRLAFTNGNRFDFAPIWPSLAAGAVLLVRSDGTNDLASVDTIATVGSPAADAGAIRLYGIDLRQALTNTMLGKPVNSVALASVAYGAVPAGSVAASNGADWLPASTPIFTTTARDALSMTASMAGTVIRNSTTNKLNTYSGSAWEAITSA